MRRRLDALAGRPLRWEVLVAVMALTVLAAVVAALLDSLAASVAAGLALGLLGALLVAAVMAGQRRAVRQRTEGLLEELPSAVLVLSAGALVYLNGAAQELFAVSDEAIGRRFAEFAPDLLEQAVAETQRLGQPLAVEFERDQHLLAARVSALDAGNVVVLIRDITPVKRLDAVRRDFVVNASHELKTPVAGIQALAESLAAALRHNPARAARMVTRIEHEAGRLAQLVRDLLDLARLEEPEGAQRRRPVDVADLVRRQVERLQPLAEQRHVVIKTALARPSIVLAVPEDIRSIITNLLENAVRYNREGGTVDVSLERADGSLALEVTDSGEGIPELERDRVFERFYRVDKGRSRADGGTGLGLALVRHATERHGGTITLRSEVGVGSTFRVELPLARPAAEPGSAEGPARLAAEPGSAQGPARLAAEPGSAEGPAAPEDEP